MDLEFEKLYDMTFPLSEDKAPLYIQGFYRNREAGGIYVNKDYYIDLGTYFNLFSLKKWTDYTTISKLKIKLNLTGKFCIEFYGMSVDNPNTSAEEAFIRTDCEDSFEVILDIDELNFKYKFELIGVKITALSDNAIFHGGEYLGSFESEREVKIGITICTFKREKYLLPNLDKLKQLISRNPNINVMVIDNGNTLNETDTEELQIIHNPNFGGAGGFTRGLIEQVNQNRNTHVILMDDDIIIELSSIDRLFSIMKHLKVEHQEKFFGGAMIKLNKPTIQHENTAYWKIRKICAFGKDFDLTKKEILYKNENIPQAPNQYAAWWFCCIPIEVVKKIGYPLPIFIRGDDMEYGIRNQKDILTMNGIGVWHETFENKFSYVTMYFDFRNMFLINHFASGCGSIIFLISCLGKVFMRILHLDGDAIRVLELALKDLNTGLTGITSIGSDEKFDALKKYPYKKVNGHSIYLAIPSVLKSTLKHFFNYDAFDKELKNFRKEKLSDQRFWRSFLGINNEI